MDDTETTQELQVLDEMGNKVREITKFEQTVEGLKGMVAESAKITVTDLSDPVQLEAVKRSRIDLRAMEISIETRGLGYRRVFIAVNKEISSKEGELKKITTPEIERLKAIEEEAEKLALIEKRKALLPSRKERLTQIDDTGCYISADEYLIEMDATAFEEYINHCTANKNERMRLRAEAVAETKRLAEQKKIDDERAVLDADIKKEEDRKKAEVEEKAQLELKEKEEKEAEEKLEYEKEQKRREGLLPERKKALGLIKDDVPLLEDRLMLAMSDSEYTTYYNDRVTAKNTADKAIIDGKTAEVEEAKEETERKAGVAKKRKEELHKLGFAEKAGQGMFIKQGHAIGIELIENGDEEEYQRVLKGCNDLIKGETDRVVEQEKKEAYVKFLKSHGWTKETRHLFKTEETAEGGYELWKQVGVFTNK